MKVSSTQDLYNRIMKYIRTHGRLVFGATVLLCLIFYLVWRESTWSEVEHLESPIQVHAKQETKRENKGDSYIAGKGDPAIEGQEGQSIKRHSDSKHTGNNKKGDTKETISQEESTQSALRYSVRSVIRAYPLVDSFSNEVVPLASKEDQETGEGSEGKKHISLEDTAHSSYRHRARRDHRDPREGPTLGEGRRTSPATPVRIVLQGTVVGDTSMAVVSINGTSYVLGEGEVAEQVTIESIQEHRVLIRYKGESRWIE